MARLSWWSAPGLPGGLLALGSYSSGSNDSDFEVAINRIAAPEVPKGYKVFDLIIIFTMTNVFVKTRSVSVRVTCGVWQRPGQENGSVKFNVSGGFLALLSSEGKHLIVQPSHR